MRLIDADNLVARLNDLYEWCRDERRSGIEQAMCMVHEAPTVDSEPVKRGRWNLFKYGSEILGECPFCNGVWDDYTVAGWSYCPHCGVFMRGEQDED